MRRERLILCKAAAGIYRLFAVIYGESKIRGLAGGWGEPGVNPLGETYCKLTVRLTRIGAKDERDEGTRKPWAAGGS